VLCGFGGFTRASFRAASAASEGRERKNVFYRTQTAVWGADGEAGKLSSWTLSSAGAPGPPLSRGAHSCGRAPRDVVPPFRPEFNDDILVELPSQIPAVAERLPADTKV
jgi:hypothetical protein